MSDIKIYQSLSGYGSEKFETLASLADQQSILVKFPLKLACACTQTLFIVASLVETVARRALALFIKALTFLLPAGLSKTLDTKIITPLFNHAKLSFEAVFKSLIRSLSRDASAIAFDKLYSSRFFKKIIHIHITGDSRSKEKIDGSNQLNPLPPPGPVIQPKEESEFPIKESVTGLLGLSTLAAYYKLFTRKVQKIIPPVKPILFQNVTTASTPAVVPQPLLSDSPHNPPTLKCSLFKNTFFQLPLVEKASASAPMHVVKPLTIPPEPLRWPRIIDNLNCSVFDKPTAPICMPKPVIATPTSLPAIFKPTFPIIDNGTCSLKDHLFTTPAKIPLEVEHNLTKTLPGINKTWIIAGIIAIPVIYYLGKKLFGRKAPVQTSYSSFDRGGDDDYLSPFQPMKRLVKNHTPRRLQTKKSQVEKGCIKIEKEIIQLILDKQEKMLGTQSNLREIDHKLLYILLTDKRKTARFKDALQALCQFTLSDLEEKINSNEVRTFKREHKQNLRQLERGLRLVFRTFDKELIEFDHLKQVLDTNRTSRTPVTGMFLTPTKNGQPLTPKTGFIKRHKGRDVNDEKPLQGKLDFSNV